MASKNSPTSSAELISRHSKARVLVAIQKRFPMEFNAITGLPSKFSRELTDDDAVDSMIRKYR